jgi:hypothetical protein
MIDVESKTHGVNAKASQRNQAQALSSRFNNKINVKGWDYQGRLKIVANTND